MEWGRAKSILILTFLFLNLLLGYQLWMNKFDIFGIAFGNSEEVNQVLELLQSKDIELRQDIPTEMPRVKEIDIVYQLRADKQGRVELRPALKGVVPHKESTWQEALKEQMPISVEYEMDPSLSNDKQLVLNQLYEQLPMFGVTMRLFVREGVVGQYEQSLVEVKHSSQAAKEHQALAAHRVIRLLAEKFLQAGDEITDIRLGYHGQMFNTDTQVLAPKWRITLGNGDMYYVHAVSGEVERP